MELYSGSQLKLSRWPRSSDPHSSLWARCEIYFHFTDKEAKFSRYSEDRWGIIKLQLTQKGE